MLPLPTPVSASATTDQAQHRTGSATGTLLRGCSFPVMVIGGLQLLARYEHILLVACLAVGAAVTQALRLHPEAPVDRDWEPTQHSLPQLGRSAVLSELTHLLS